MSLECWIGRAEPLSLELHTLAKGPFLLSPPFTFVNPSLQYYDTKEERWMRSFVRVLLNQLSSELLCFKVALALKHLRFVPLS